MHSIRFKITAITIAEILTAILCVFFVSSSIIQSENDRRSVEMMSLIAQDTGKSIEKYTEGIEQSVESVSNTATDTLDGVELVRYGAIGASAAQNERTPEQAEQLDAYLADYTSRIQADLATVAYHTRGVITYYYCLSPNMSESEHGFFYSKAGRTGFAERESLDARELDENDMEHTTWYYTPIKRGRPTWVGPYQAHYLNEIWVCSYVVPIYKSGTLVGVLGMDIPVETFIDLVSSIRVYDHGFACLLDEEGRVIYHPEYEFGSTLDLPVYEQMLEREESGSELIRYVTNGEECQLSFTTLSNGMKLVIIAPTAEINASSSRLTRVIVPIAIAIVAAFAVLSLLVMRHVTRPLLKLTDASQRLAAADYDVELDYKGDDEVGALTTAFQSMRQRLGDYIDDLNRKVHTDDLTGLPNQRRFFELAMEEKQRLVDEGKRPVLLYFNLMGMKHYNRQYGFSEGDKLICDVARILARHFGEQTTSRFAQDHFAVVTDEEGLSKRLYKVFNDCEAANDGKSLPVSAGVYQDSFEDVDASVACDRAKYACDRRRGSYFSGYRFFDKTMLRKADLFRYVVSHLDQALKEQWIEVYYQPIVRSVNGRVCDEEALSRWNDPIQGRLSPADFVPALENSGLIYKLDLYVLDQVLEKIWIQQENGLHIVPQSINLSRSDFDVLDMVEEIRRRVDEAGVCRDRITIEITESIIGRDFDFMKRQVERFQELGFPVWMDDFGSGYSSLDLLQTIKFDLLKFDMSFLRKLDEGENGKVILTELMRMATALGVDTLCEGVETVDQVRFLREIGCSKLQGYYYSKPNSLEQILERYEKGIQIGFENPEESEYYEAIGRVNLHDLTAIAHEDENPLQNIFNTLPMGIMQIKGSKVEFVRTNQSYRDFMMRSFGPDLAEAVFGTSAAEVEELPFMKHARECCEDSSRNFFDEVMPDGSVAHFLARRIRTNPVNGATAVAIAVLSIAEPGGEATYASIVRALAADYYRIYYVDLYTERFVEYSFSTDGEELAVERRGEAFFETSRREAKQLIYAEDRATFLRLFTRENVLSKLEERRTYTAAYRLVIEEGSNPVLATMKVTRMEPDGRHVIVGVSIQNEQ